MGKGKIAVNGVAHLAARMIPEAVSHILGAVAQGAARAEKGAYMNAVAVPVSETRGKRWMLWTGWVLSVWPVFIVVLSATWKLTRNPWYVAEFTRIGWPESALTLLACLQLGSIVLFVIPRTAVLGAILLTGYLGGAIATYTRMGEPYPVLVPLSTSMIAWAGIWLRDARLRSLLPFRQQA